MQFSGEKQAQEKYELSSQNIISLIHNSRSIIDGRK